MNINVDCDGPGSKVFRRQNVAKMAVNGKPTRDGSTGRIV